MTTLCKFNTYWKHKDTEKVLSFDIIDNPISRKFIKVVKNRIDNKDNFVLPTTQNHYVFPMFISKKAMYDDMLKQFDIVKDTAKDINIPKYEDINQKVLNDLHELFHISHDAFMDKIQDNVDEKGKIMQAWERINHIVHQYEASIGTQNWHFVINFGKYNSYAETIDETDRQYFDKAHTNNKIKLTNYGLILNVGGFKISKYNLLKIIAIVFNKKTELKKYANFKIDRSVVLKAGYATVGKNLLHCAEDNDVSVVKNNLVRPQKNITESVIIEPVNTESIKVSSQHKIKNFIKKNNLQEYIDWQNPKNLYCDQPVLGYVAKRNRTSSDEDYYNLNTNYKCYKADIS